MGRSHMPVTVSSGWAYKRSSTADTSPALEFSKGSTPNWVSPRQTASHTSAQVENALLRAKGNSRRSAMWLHAPSTP